MIDVVVSPTFDRQVKELKKRYKSIGKDINEFVSQPLKNGNVIGEQVRGVGYTVFKVRVPNRDAKRGKSGGYRVVYYLKAETMALLLSIYAKSDQADIKAADIRNIIGSFEKKTDAAQSRAKRARKSGGRTGIESIAMVECGNNFLRGFVGLRDSVGNGDAAAPIAAKEQFLRFRFKRGDSV